LVARVNQSSFDSRAPGPLDRAVPAIRWRFNLAANPAVALPIRRLGELKRRWRDRLRFRGQPPPDHPDAHLPGGETQAAAAAPRLSAIVITRNEAANIGECLDSIAFCDERIVVDCGSSDGTLLIAKEKGVRVAFHEWKGFGPQKNYALSLARGDWVLSIDADERVTPELAAEIRSAIQGAEANGFELLRSSTFCGSTIRYSGWSPDRVLRLFRRGKGRFTDDVVHERVACEGTISRLKAVLLHYPVARLEDAIRRMDTYSTLGAEKIAASGRRISIMTAIAHGLFAFLRTYVLRLGFLDGAAGFMLAVAIAEGSYYRYMKAWLLQRNRNL
jgi:glycosyltransferase involved in cell wall biosynthesis